MSTRTDRYTAPGAAAALDAPTAELVPLAEFLALEPAARREVRGVLVAPADDVTPLVPELDGLAVVAIDFPTFTDGRGCSHARRLRTTHGYAGELRAVGDVRADQARSLLRCGFGVLEFESPVGAQWLEMKLGLLPGSYQPSYDVSAEGRANA